MLDIIGAAVIVGLLFLTIFAVDNNVTTFAKKNHLDLIGEESLAQMISQLDWDLRKMGYRVSRPDCTVIAFDSNMVKFRSDIDNNGVMDIVEYYVGAAGQMGTTQNPRDFILYRKVGNQTSGAALGVTRFKLQFYKYNNAPANNPSEVSSVEILLRVESPFPVDTTYSWTSVKGRLHPRNLQRL
jgi:hypothetical protein